MTAPASGASAFDALFPEFDNEIATTRRILAVVPDGKNDWTPHEKSMTLGKLATHLAELPSFGTTMTDADEYDFAVSGWVSPKAETTAERLAIFDERSSALKAALQKSDWDSLGKDWVLRSGEHVIMKDKRAKHLRTLITHMAHHRAQLGVYLRLLNIPVPGSYGPSADDK